MLKDIKRHLRKRVNKITLIILLFNNFCIFFEDGDITIIGIIMFIGSSFLGYFMFSWGFDNPELNKPVSKQSSK